MYAKLTIPERLKDLRVVDKHLTLEQLAEQTGDVYKRQQPATPLQIHSIFSPPDREKGTRFPQKVRCLITPYLSLIHIFAGIVILLLFTAGLAIKNIVYVSILQRVQDFADVYKRQHQFKLHRRIKIIDELAVLCQYVRLVIHFQKLIVYIKKFHHLCIITVADLKMCIRDRYSMFLTMDFFSHSYFLYLYCNLQLI